MALFAIALLAAFVSLVLATQLPAPGWLFAVDGIAVSLSVATLAGLGWVLEKIPVRALHRPLLQPAAFALFAGGLRPWLVASLAPASAVPRIDFVQLLLAALSGSAALFALFVGTARLGHARTWYDSVVLGAAMTVAFYVLGPLLERAGLPVDVRTFVALSSLGLGAYGLTEASRRLPHRRLR